MDLELNFGRIEDTQYPRPHNVKHNDNLYLNIEQLFNWREMEMNNVFLNKSC